MRDKPSILLMDIPRYRSPLLDQFYNHISRKDGPFTVIRPTVEEFNLPVEDVINKLLGELPDYIYWGFSAGSGLIRSSDYLLKNRGKVKIIIDPGDYEQFTREVPHGIVANFEPVWVDYVVVRCRKIKGYRTMNMVEEFIPTREWLKGAKIINVPWGVNPDSYPEKNLERDIDVSLICTASGHMGYHTSRKKAAEVLGDLDKNINVFVNTHCGPKIVGGSLVPHRWKEGGIKVFDVFNEDYLNILCRSKIFIVTGAGRDFMVQKYCEGPACGAMLLGEIPTPAKEFLKDGISMVEVKDFDKLKEVILETLKDPERIKRIAEEGRKEILENFAVDKVSQEFEETIMDDYRR